jgi:acetyltransferase-like isoleucine patch superfamily enzyme
MTSPSSPGARAYVRENGWLQLFSRASKSFCRRFRDFFTARRLRAPGFRIGACPRILGLAHMRIGAKFSAGDNLWLEAVTHYAGQVYSPQLTIADNVNLSDRVHIACLNKITIGPGLLSGSSVLISDHAHGVYRNGLLNATGDALPQSGPATTPVHRPLSSNGEIVIGANVWLGDNVAVLAGARIGDGAIIGANSVVTGDIPPATIATGAPARPIRQWNSAAKQWLPI